jgi:hypothetical protein
MDGEEKENDIFVGEKMKKGHDMEEKATHVQ